MATGFSVMDALNKNSKAGVDESPRARFRTKDISIFKMYRNKLNFYDLEDIEELAGDILMYGLKQNLEVVFEPNEQGEYRIVAGERRWLALKHLVEQGYKDFEIATCKLTTPQDEDEEQVEIIIANAYRTKSLKDVIEEEQRLKACLERMKTDGKKIKGYDLQSGRLRDVIASMLKMSKTKIAQIESVNNNLIPEFREELNNERLTFSAAYELSGMSPEMQQEALAKYKENGELSYTEIKDMKSPQKPEQEQDAAGQQDTVSDSDTAGQQLSENSMNPPEEKKAGDDYETPHPEGITSICYSCTEYETCNVKTGTCTSCDQYKNRAEAYKTDEQRYNEEQDAAGQQDTVSDSDTAGQQLSENSMNPPEEKKAGDDYETPHPEGITSICYSCTEYETCNVKTGTCTSCDQYKNRAEAYKTDEQRYNEEQDAIDRETKKKLREQAEEEKMNNLPSDTQENGQKVHHIKLGATFFEEVASGEKTFELRKNDRDYKKGDILEMMEFKDGKNTGRTVRVLVTYILEEFAGLEDGYCIMATSLMKEDAE